MNKLRESIEIETNRLPGYSVDRSVPAVSAVSWGAVLAGAVAAAALSLILLMLGTGLGLSSVSPWAQAGVTATTFGVATIAWVIFTQLAASAFGGYLAGRLRTKWIEIHADEAYFRDTAHGFLAWGLASLATAALLTSAIGSIVGNGIQAGNSLAAGATTPAPVSAASASATAANSEDGYGLTGYFVDALFRREPNTTVTGTLGTDDSPASAKTAVQPSAATLAEVARIFMNPLRAQALPPEDIRYVGEAVAQRTGMTRQDAEKRVTDTYARLQTTLHDTETTARADADKVRKASAHASLWLFISLLIGAFAASMAATYGGRQRDS